MLEIIDLLLLFWVAVAVGVCTLGSLYEKQQQAKLRDAKGRRTSFNPSSYDRWGSPHQLEPTRTASSSYNNYNSSPYDSYNSSYTNQSSGAGANYGQAPIGRSSYDNQQSYNQQSSSSYTSPYSSSSAGYNQTQSSAGHDEYSTHFDRNNFDNLMRESYGAKGYSMSPQPSNLDQSTRGGSIPTATGFNNDCVEWLNGVLYLLYTQTHKYAPQIAESVYRSMNEKLSNITSQSAEFSDLIIEFTGINRELSSRPELTNVRTESELDKSVSANCKLYIARIVLDLTVQKTRIGSSIGASQFTDQLDQATRYEVCLENLEGKLKAMAVFKIKLIVAQFLEKPDMKILLRPKYSGGSSGACPINEDVLVKLIVQTLEQVVVDLYFGDDVDFPQYKSHQTSPNTLQSAYRSKLNAIKGGASEIKRHIKNDFFGALTSDHKERKVFIKILRAKNINYNQNVTCLLELDNPYQQALSSTQQGSNPYWDEHFLFNVSEKSSELSLELWDSINVANLSGQTDETHKHKRTKSVSGSSVAQIQQQAGQVRNAKNKWNKSELTSSAKFLGVARVSIEELRKNPVQKCSLTLQSSAKSNPAEASEHRGLIVGSDLSNSVGGELQVELLFLEHSSSSSTSGATNASNLHKSGSSTSLGHLAQGDVVSVDRKLTPSGYVITTTTITKPVGQAPSSKRASNHQQLEHLHLTLPRSQSPINSLGTEQSELDFDGVSSTRLTDVATPTTDLDANLEAGQQERASRSRSRSRSLLRAIKKRFSFSRTRSRSVGESLGVGGGGGATSAGAGQESGWSQPGTAQSNLDRLSIESRSRASSDASASASGRARSVPASRDPNEVPVIVINKGRLSDTASAFTFVHPKSQLVIECSEPRLNENGTVSTSKFKARLRYYAIPDDAANKRKWRKRGVKLHLFNEHQFVACHLAGSSTCHLCGRVFSRRPGKQGYKCRNCHLLSHKACHVKVDHNCPYATKDGLELEYIDADPPASLVMEAGARSAGTLPDGRQANSRKRELHMGAKSVSMDMDDR